MSVKSGTVAILSNATCNDGSHEPLVATHSRGEVKTTLLPGSHDGRAQSTISQLVLPNRPAQFRVLLSNIPVEDDIADPATNPLEGT